MKLIQAGLMTLALTTVATAAMAEVTTAGERLAANNAALGVRVGAFTVTPKADLDVEFNDNIFATQNNTTDDVITKVRPEVTARSGWSRHALNALARVESNIYGDNDAEDHTNYTAAVDGRLDVMRDTAIGGGISWVRNHEDRGTPSAVGTGTKPTQIDTVTTKLGAYRKLGKANVRVDGQMQNLDYKNGFTSTGALVNSSLRDRNEYDLTARAGYQATDIAEVFVKGGINTIVYDNKGGATLNRSSHGDTAVVGVAAELTGKTKGEAYVGYDSRNYVEPALKDIREATYGAKLTWNTSDLTTIIGSIDRGIEETTVGNSSGYVATSYDLGVEHAIRQNALLNAGVNFTNSEYQGTAGTQRDDDVIGATVGGKYFFNRNLSGSAGYTYKDRDSNIAGGNYDRNVFMLRLTGTY